MARSRLPKPAGKSLRAPQAAPSFPSPSGVAGSKLKGLPAEHPSLEYMQKNNIPMTRESYLALNYGDPNFKLDAEGESMLPPQFQKKLE